MTEIITKRINIEELKIVRITCTKCGVVSEMLIDKLTSNYEHEVKCKHCGEKFPTEVGVNYFMKLQDVFKTISGKTEFDFEFCIPVNKKTEK